MEMNEMIHQNKTGLVSLKAIGLRLSLSCDTSRTQHRNERNKSNNKNQFRNYYSFPYRLIIEPDIGLWALYDWLCMRRSVA